MTDSQSPRYSHKARHGSYEIVPEGDLLIVHFTGTLSDTCSQHYLADLKRAIKDLTSPFWGYIGDAKNYDASTPGAVGNIKEAYLYGYQYGSRVDAYHIDSALGIAQLANIRKSCHFPSDIYERLFDDLESAKAFARKYLENVNQ